MSILDLKTKQNVFFRPNYLPSCSRRIPPDGRCHQLPPRTVGPEVLPSDSAELWTRWTNRPRCTVTAVSLFFFFWKQEEHLAKRILSSQWDDVRQDLLSRAALGASLRQAGPRPACCADSYAARDCLGFVHCWNILKTL